MITGAPAWLKPAKFAISVAVYSFTFVYLLQFVRGRKWLVAFAANVTALALLVEVAILVGQVIRGTTSHFNYSTPLDATLFQIDGRLHHTDVDDGADSGCPTAAPAHA